MFFYLYRPPVPKEKLLKRGVGGAPAGARDLWPHLQAFRKHGHSAGEFHGAWCGFGIDPGGLLLWCLRNMVFLCMVTWFHRINALQ